MKIVAVAAALVLAAFRLFQPPPPTLLVFTKTAGYRHASIDTAVNAIKKLGSQNNFVVETTSNTTLFTETGLKKYAAIVFLHTTGNILNTEQEAEFERYIQAGGGFVGIHAAADAEYDWHWYGQLVGGYFNGHPAQQKATLHITDSSHGSTKHLPAEWTRFDEWYNFQQLDSSIHALMTIDETSYQGGTNGDHHPIAWWHDFDGGRAFYTALGHTEASYADPMFLQHLLGGILYAIGENKPLDFTKVKTQRPPNENYFSKNILTQGTLTEPTEMAILPNNDVLIAQRRGEIVHYNALTKLLTPAGKLNVYFQSADTNVNAEEGLLGITADPMFSKNHFIYLYYAAADTPVNRLSRFVFSQHRVLLASEKIILQLYSQRDICCHTGGSLAFDSKGNLYLSTGDNTTPFDEPNQPFTTKGYAPIDDRPGHEQYDDRRTSGNTNDLRGKILRIKVQPDGTYTIPEGNLFHRGIPDTKPEIYVMGARNPYRISIDAKTNYLYWGEIGPDAADNDTARGPMGYDEINQAKSAGNFGYPFFIADNYPYRAYDYTNGQSAEWYNAAAPLNNSRNNTGLKDLPPAQPAMLWYPYGSSYEYPQLGSGGRSAMAGPVYHGKAYPNYYKDKLFIYDWMRGWIKAVTFDRHNNFYKLEPFMPHTSFNAPIDMEVGPDGKIYVLEYGKGWFTQNADAALSCIEFDSTANNRLSTSNKQANKTSIDSAAFGKGHVQKKITPAGLAAIQRSDCLTCHKTNEKSIGPSFTSVARKYAANKSNTQYLVNKIRNGGAGIWGPVPMAAHPSLEETQVKQMVEYILSFRNAR
jgi:cytochrome c